MVCPFFVFELHRSSVNDLGIDHQALEHRMSALGKVSLIEKGTGMTGGVFGIIPFAIEIPADGLQLLHQEALIPGEQAGAR
jgi:hypothetical protein